MGSVEKKKSVSYLHMNIMYMEGIKRICTFVKLT